MPNALHEFIIENKQINSLSFNDIYKLGAEISSYLSSIDIQPLIIQNNEGIFVSNTASKPIPEVTVIQSDEQVSFKCSCGFTKKLLCEHQALVLQGILSKPEIKVFFDQKIRQEKLKIGAKAYGMSEFPDLEQYFKLVYENREAKVVSLNADLLALDMQQACFIKSKIFPPKTVKAISESSEKKFLVFKRNKFTENYTLEYCAAATTKNGELKNPVTIIDPLASVQNHENTDILKFFMAVAQCQKNLESTDNESLVSIIKNPLLLDFYICDAENISINNILSVMFPPNAENSSINFGLNINFKEPFYEIVARLSINDQFFGLDDIRLRFGNFIQIGNKLTLVNIQELIPVIQYFKEKRAIILIHPNKFELFKKEILDPLANTVDIDYTYLKESTKINSEPVYEEEVTIEKLVYLTDEKNFVSITPVIKYGKLEVAVQSQKQLVDIDANGNHFKVNRDENLELWLTALVARLHPEFEEQLTTGNFFYLHKQKVLDQNWFIDAFEILRQNNIKILGFNTLSNNKLNLNKAQVQVSVESGIDWFNTKVLLKFGQKQVPLSVLHKSLRNKANFVELDDGTQGIIPEEWIKKFNSYFKAGKLDGAVWRTPKSQFMDILDIYEQEIMHKEMWAEVNYLKNQLDNFNKIEPVNIPKNLNGSLRDYQKHGVNWLCFLDKFNFGACLADDMGLGKTLQVITFLLIQQEKQKGKPSLVVMPTSILFNWKNELEHFAPSLKFQIHHGNSKLNNADEFSKFDIILTTYGTLISDLYLIKKTNYNYIILDESQAIKNPNSQRYLAARSLKSRNKIIMTGTPFENNTYDIYGQLSFACPDLLGSKNYFKDIYAEPIDKFHDQKRAEILRKKISPFILRRTKKQVLKELPQKTEMLVYCEMGTEQRAIYERHETELRDYLNGKKDDNIDQIHVLAGLTKLRQICDSPALLSGEQFMGEDSSKIDVLMDQIENQITEHKILVFSQYVGMLDLIKKALITKNIAFEYLTGQSKNRDKIVQNFQENPEVRVFLISLKAGGVGLNLTAADYVYLVDPWWNPAVENQAIDRVYRIGQKNKVIAVRLICPDTVEDKIRKLQATKSTLASKLVLTDATVFKEFNKKELLEILGG